MFPDCCDLTTVTPFAKHELEVLPLVVLTQPDIRRFVRKLIDAEFPAAQVVSFAELLPEVSLRPLAKASLVGI